MACSSAAAPGSASPASSAPVTATLSVTAATLGDDCPAAGRAAADAKAARVDADAYMAEPPPCTPSSVQLQLTAVGAGAAAPVVVSEVALLDAAGTHLGTLTPNAPLVWRADAYQAWDASLRAGDALRLSVPTSAPPWATMPGGRWGTRMFQVEVTVTVAGAPVTARSTVSIAPEPMMDT
jgi:hypothetical protein